jgi:hypothetical protein
MQRLVYVKKEDGIYQSKYEIITRRGTIYRVFLHEKDNYFRIYNVKRQRSLVGGEKSKNLRALKREVKRKLVSLGVDFDIEVRKPSSK